MKIRTKYRVFIDESQPELGHIDKGTEFKAFQVDHGIECTYFHVATNDDHKYPGLRKMFLGSEVDVISKSKRREKIFSKLIALKLRIEDWYTAINNTWINTLEKDVFDVLIVRISKDIDIINDTIKEFNNRPECGLRGDDLPILNGLADDYDIKSTIITLDKIMVLYNKHMGISK